MADTTHVAQPTDDPGTAHTASTSRLNQALAWVGIVAGGLFIVAAIFFAGFFLNDSEHMHMQMGHAPMAHEQKDCCADMKPGGMKPGEMKPSAMGPEMMGPPSGR
jgi:predicted nucleic acid-binding Zn ribbon protein